MRDTAGLTSTTQITVTIQGGNDAPYDESYSAGSGINFAGAGHVASSNLGVNTAASAATTVEFWMKWDGTANAMPFGFYAYDLWFNGGRFWI